MYFARPKAKLLSCVEQKRLSLNASSGTNKKVLSFHMVLEFLELCDVSMYYDSSANRAPSSVTSSVLPPYPGPVARPRDRPLQAYFQQSPSVPIARTSLISTGRRSSSHRGLAQVAPIASSSDQSSGFYFFSSSSSGRTFQEAENPLRDHFHAWERDHREQQPGFPLSQVDRDSIWAPFHQPAGGSDTGIRSSSFRPRHGSERMPSQHRS